jgi:hypothetical protein
MSEITEKRSYIVRCNIQSASSACQRCSDFLISHNEEIIVVIVIIIIIIISILCLTTILIHQGRVPSGTFQLSVTDRVTSAISAAAGEGREGTGYFRCRLVEWYSRCKCTVRMRLPLP